MGSVKILGEKLSNMPWQDAPEGCTDVLWRHTGNPIMGWNYTPDSARIYNSAVVPYEGGFKGIFRADHKDGIPHLHMGSSSDGINWKVENEKIIWKDADGEIYDPVYAYDPRIVKLDDKYYIVWCTDFGGPTLGLGVTQDFKEFVRLENVFIPFNRNGVLFPRKNSGKLCDAEQAE